MEFRDLEPKDKIASGPYADVYQCGKWAVKVFKEKRPKTEVLYEALVNAEIEATGLPVPRVRDVTRLPNKQWVIASQLVKGKTLLEIMKQDQEHLEQYVNQMVELQLQIHAKTCPHLIKLEDRLMDRINESNDIDQTKKYELMTVLEGMKKHQKLCHGNFSPSNIIIDNQGCPVVVDWVEAAQGNASADAAHTYLMLHLEIKEAADLYLDRFCKESHIEKQYVQQWLPIVAAAHLKYTKNEEERDLLLHWIDVLQYQ